MVPVVVLSVVVVEGVVVAVPVSVPVVVLVVVPVVVVVLDVSVVCVPPQADREATRARLAAVKASVLKLKVITLNRLLFS